MNKRFARLLAMLLALLVPVMAVAETAEPEEIPAEAALEPEEIPAEATVEPEEIVVEPVEAAVEVPAAAFEAEVPDVEAGFDLIEEAPEPALEPTPEPAAQTEAARVEAQPAAEAVEASDPDVTLGVGETYVVDGRALLYGGDAITGYSSTNPAVALVDARTGEVTALAVGFAEIAVETAGDESGLLALAVLAAPDSLTLSEETLELKIDEAARLTYALPDGTAAHRVDFASSDPAVCTVDGFGNVLAVGAGKATVTATAYNGASAGCAVTVPGDAEPTPPPGDAEPTVLTLPEPSLKLGVGEWRTLKPSVGAGEAATYTFASSDRAVATVSKKGKVIARGRGSAKITVRTQNGLTAVVKVKVAKAPTSIELSETKLVLNAGQAAALSATLSKGASSRLRWKSSKPGVVAVDADGRLTPVSAGAATITVQTYNNLKAKCKVTVLAGGVPTALTVKATVKLGVDEPYTLVPTLGAGEEAKFTFTSSNTKIVKVNAKGALTARKRGTATVTVSTHNGLSATATVKVVKKPTKLTLSQRTLELQVGEKAKLKATPSSGSHSAITWSSDKPDIASVDAKGNVKARQPGTATVTAMTYNGVTAACVVTVPGDAPEPETEAQRRQRMLDNLREDSSLGLGGKKDAVIGVIRVLMDAGFEPAFAAGVAANVYSEGTYGLFESSKYVSHPEKRPRYFAYLDGGAYYSKQNGEYVLTDVYLTADEYDDYDGDAEKHLCFGERNYYLDNFSKKYAPEVDLNELEAFLAELSDGGWQGKFGLGVVQWTGGRTKKLVEFYRRHAGSGSAITSAQVVAAENEMILYELNGSYRFVYNAWQSDNPRDTATAEAARSAGALVCLRYEVPADRETKAVQRGAKAAAIYQVMAGD